MSQSKSFVFGSNEITKYIFDFFGSPFTSLRNKLSSNQPPVDQLIPTQNTPQEFPQHDTQTLHEPTASDRSTQAEPNTTNHEIDEPPSLVDSSLPTAFIPHFPSLSRPSMSNRGTSQSNQTVLNFARPSSSTRPLKLTQTRIPSRRTLYIGPGHSSMNSSTRLGIARRKRSGVSSSSSILGSNYDTLSQISTESPKEVHHQSHRTLDPFEEQSPKRIKLSSHHDMSSRLVDSSSRTQSQPEPSPPTQISSLPIHQAENPKLRGIKNSNVTPMRPSPLRNVTLPPVASSPTFDRDSTPDTQISPSLPKKRNHNQAALIMSSVMKEVNLEISNRTPAPSPIRPSAVINPYAHLQQRPIKNKPACRSAPSEKSAAHPSYNHDESENRKRKVLVCLDGDTTNHHNDSVIDNHINYANSSQNPIEQILQKTMPKEFRPNETVQKKKTRQVGRLSERLLKKQQLREQGARSSSGNSLPNKNINQDNIPLQSSRHRATGPSNNSHQPTASLQLHDSPFSTNKPVTPFSEQVENSPSTNTNVNPSEKIPLKNSTSATEQPIQLKANKLIDLKQSSSSSPSPIKTFQQIPSSSLFGIAGPNSKSASTRSSLLSASNQLMPPTLNEHNQNNNRNLSSTTENGNGDHHSDVDQNQKELRIQENELGYGKFKSEDKRVEEEAVKRIKKKEGDASGKGIQKEAQKSERVEEEADMIMDLVKGLKEDEIRKHFNQDLLTDYLNDQSESTLNKFNNNNTENIDLNIETIKEAALGLSPTELNSFVFL